MDPMSIQRLWSSLLMRMSAPVSAAVNAKLANWLPWSLLKMSGVPKCASASSAALTQKPTLIVFDSRHASNLRVAQSIIVTSCGEPRTRDDVGRGVSLRIASVRAALPAEGSSAL